MVAVSSSALATSALVLSLTSASSQESGSFLNSTSTPKTTTELISSTISSDPTSINNLTANVAAPAIANLLQPSDVSSTTLLAASLGVGTSVDALIEQSNDAFANKIEEITSKPLASISTEPLKILQPVESNDNADAGGSVQDANTTSTTTFTSATDQTNATTVASAYTRTANYGNTSSGGSGSFSLAV